MAQLPVAFAFEYANGLSVETNAYDEEKGSAIRLPDRDGACFTVEKCPCKSLGQLRQINLSCKDVTGSHRNDSEWHRKANKSLYDVVDSPIASSRNNRIEAPTLGTIGCSLHALTVTNRLHNLSIAA